MPWCRAVRVVCGGSTGAADAKAMDFTNIWCAVYPVATPAAKTDPNAYQDPDIYVWIVNTPEAHRLDGWRAKGGEDVCGKPLAGMTNDRDCVYRQLCENVLLEIRPKGSGGHPKHCTRFGSLEKRYNSVVAHPTT
jgi:hypothetical protein